MFPGAHLPKAQELVPKYTLRGEECGYEGYCSEDQPVCVTHGSWNKEETSCCPDLAGPTKTGGECGGLGQRCCDDDREECHAWVGYYTPEEECHQRGCNWGPVHYPGSENVVPWCYKSSNEDERVDCGYSGMSSQECGEKGCCWDPVTGEGREGVPACYRSFTRKVEDRIDCGHKGIDKDACLAKGCNWDPVAESPPSVPDCFRRMADACPKCAQTNTLCNNEGICEKIGGMVDGTFPVCYDLPYSSKVGGKAFFNMCSSGKEGDWCYYASDCTDCPECSCVFSKSVQDSKVDDCGHCTKT